MPALALDTLALLGNRSEFRRAVRLVVRQVSFEQNSTVQLFETTIRLLGGLLSAHALATTPAFGVAFDGYRGELLTLAADLGKRLLPAFDTKTGIPYGTVNLRYGVPQGETKVASLASTAERKLKGTTEAVLTAHTSVVKDGLWIAAPYVLGFIDLFHPTITRTLCSFFSCRDLGAAGSWLELDYSVQCARGPHEEDGAFYDALFRDYRCFKRAVWKKFHLSERSGG